MARWPKKCDQICPICHKKLFPHANGRDKAIGKKIYHKKCFRKHELARHTKGYVPKAVPMAVPKAKGEVNR